MPVIQKVFCCSVCDKSYPTASQCAQHCSQPRSFCNKGKNSAEFATVIPVVIRVGNDSRVVGGTASRRDPVAAGPAAAGGVGCAGDSDSEPESGSADSGSEHEPYDLQGPGPPGSEVDSESGDRHLGQISLISSQICTHIQRLRYLAEYNF